MTESLDNIPGDGLVLLEAAIRQICAQTDGQEARKLIAIIPEYEPDASVTGRLKRLDIVTISAENPSPIASDSPLYALSQAAEAVAREQVNKRWLAQQHIAAPHIVPLVAPSEPAK